MTTEETGLTAAIARIDATLASMEKAQAAQDRNMQQVIRSATDTLVAMIHTQDVRIQNMDERVARVEKKFDSVEGRVDEKFDSVEGRVSALERFNAKLVGVAVGASALSSGATALLLRAVGG